MPNGLGGANDVLVVEEAGKPCAPIRILGEREGELAVAALPKGQELVAFWNTYQVGVRKAEDGSLRVAIPSEASEAERSQLHLYTYNAARFGGEAMVPLHEGAVLSSTAQLRRDDWESATMYFALVDRFSNGNPLNDRPLKRPDVLPANDYHGGDVEGVQKRMEQDYFEDLGFNTIWLSPLHRNPQGAWGLWNKGGVFTRFSGYHGYWPTSTSHSDARMGTEDEIRRFNQVAHERGLNTLIDFVGHHVHLEHPVLKAHPDWTTSLYLPDSSLNTERWDEHRLTTWFDTHLPTLNSQNPSVVMAMTDSALPWIQDYGFDGFRHDASKHVDLLYWRTLTRKLKEQVAHTEGRRLFWQLGRKRSRAASHLGGQLGDLRPQPLNGQHQRQPGPPALCFARLWPCVAPRRHQARRLHPRHSQGHRNGPSALGNASRVQLCDSRYSGLLLRRRNRPGGRQRPRQPPRHGL